MLEEQDDGTASVEEKKAILLVVDDEEQVILAMRAVREHGIVHEVEEVVIAGDGCEALAWRSPGRSPISLARPSGRSGMKRRIRTETPGSRLEPR